MKIENTQKILGIQENQYRYPYHYIPQWDGREFSQSQYWSWGYRYLGGMQVAKSLCEMSPYSSLLDIGCGDGRFISELAKEGFNGCLTGIDYSAQAISLAKALNPGLDYRMVNILDEDLVVDGPGYDVVTLIEVIEHIALDKLNAFIRKAVSCLSPGGRLVLTVPHQNKAVSDKHFQHFDSAVLSQIFSPYLTDIKLQPFDKKSKVLKVFFNVIGGHGHIFLITSPWLLGLFMRVYLSKYLYTESEDLCQRIALMGRKPQTDFS